MNNNNYYNTTITYIKHDCFENNIYKDSPLEIKIENFSKIFKSDTNQVISIRRIWKFALLNILKALEKWIDVNQRRSNRKRDY